MSYPSLEPFYNPQGLKNVFITLDVDWAPDFVLNFTLQWFWRQDIPVTVFATHKTNVLENERDNPLLEIGIHPNISRGKTPEEAIGELKEVYPESLGSRGHRNMAGRDLTDVLHSMNFQYDVSKLLWQAPSVQCTPLYNGMVEAPYVWEDGVHMEMGLPLDLKSANFNSPGLKIINFHPVLFYLNCTNDDQRKSVVSQYTDLTQAPSDVFESARNSTYGMGDFSRDLLLDLKTKGVKFSRLGELMAQAYQIEQETRKRNPHAN